MATLFCTNCGVNLDPGQNFCGKCGASINTSPDLESQQNYMESKEKSPKSQIKKLGIPIVVLVILAIVIAMVSKPEKQAGISADYLVSNIEKSLKLKFTLDPLGTVTDPTVDKWYGSGSRSHPISLLFYPNGESLNSSPFLKNEFDKGNAYVTCETFAAFGKNTQDIYKIYKALIKIYPNCKIPESESSSPTDNGENYSSDSVAGSSASENQAPSLPNCQRLADTVNGGLALDSNGGSHWGKSDGKPGFCILPNSGGQKFYYSGE